MPRIALDHQEAFMEYEEAFKEKNAFKEYQETSWGLWYTFEGIPRGSMED